MAFLAGVTSKLPHFLRISIQRIDYEDLRANDGESEKYMEQSLQPDNS